MFVKTHHTSRSDNNVLSFCCSFVTYLMCKTVNRRHCFRVLDSYNKTKCSIELHKTH